MAISPNYIQNGFLSFLYRPYVFKNINYLDYAFFCYFKIDKYAYFQLF